MPVIIDFGSIFAIIIGCCIGLGIKINKEKTRKMSLSPMTRALESVKNANSLSTSDVENDTWKIPSDVREKIRETEENIKLLLSQSSNEVLDEDTYTLKAIITDYLPEVLAKYYISQEDKKTQEAEDKLRLQVEIVYKSTVRLVKESGHDDSLTEFLKERLEKK